MAEQTGRVVVGYDGSAQAAQGVEWAAAEAARRDRLLTVLYVVDYSRFVVAGGGGGGVEWRPYLAQESGMVLAEKGVERAREAAPHVHVNGQAEVGAPIRVLLEASREAELLVVGTRGYGELRNLAVGSVAAAVAAHASCPVVIMRGNAGVVSGPEHPVVVGVDGSATSEAALDFASATAQRMSAPLVVVCAWNVLLQDAWVGVDARVLIDRDDLLRTERAAGQRILDAAVERVRTQHPDLAVTGSLVEAAPADALLRAGADAGLIVVGTHGHGAFMSFLLGSVSHAVVHASTRPVATVRGRKPAPGSAAQAQEEHAASSTP